MYRHFLHFRDSKGTWTASCTWFIESIFTGILPNILFMRYFKRHRWYFGLEILALKPLSWYNFNCSRNPSFGLWKINFIVETTYQQRSLLLVTKSNVSLRLHPIFFMRYAITTDGLRDTPATLEVRYKKFIPMNINHIFRISKCLIDIVKSRV